MSLKMVPMRSTLVHLASGQAYPNPRFPSPWQGWTTTCYDNTHRHSTVDHSSDYQVHPARITCCGWPPSVGRCVSTSRIWVPTSSIRCLPHLLWLSTVRVMVWSLVKAGSCSPLTGSDASRPCTGASGRHVNATSNCTCTGVSRAPREWFKRIRDHTCRSVARRGTGNRFEEAAAATWSGLGRAGTKQHAESVTDPLMCTKWPGLIAS